MFSIRLRQRRVPKTSTCGCSASRYSARWDPAKPVMPVIRALMSVHRPAYQIEVLREPGAPGLDRTAEESLGLSYGENRVGGTRCGAREIGRGDGRDVEREAGGVGDRLREAVPGNRLPIAIVHDPRGAGGAQVAERARQERRVRGRSELVGHDAHGSAVGALTREQLQHGGGEVRSAGPEEPARA